MTAHPTQLEMDPQNRLQIQWSDGQKRVYTLQELRDQCPCATCREKRSAPQQQDPFQLPVLSAAEAQPLRIIRMRPVGNYAYSIAFSDGHDTGIYTFEFLQSLGAAGD